MAHASDNCGTKEEINDRIDYFVGQTVDRYFNGLGQPQLWLTRDGKLVKRYFNGKIYDQVEGLLKRLCLTRMNEILRASDKPPRNLVDPNVDEDHSFVNDVNSRKEVNVYEEYYKDSDEVYSDGGQTTIIDEDEEENDIESTVAPLHPWDEPFVGTSKLFEDIPWMGDNPTVIPSVPNCENNPNCNPEKGLADFDMNLDDMSQYSKADVNRRFGDIPNIKEFMVQFKRAGHNELSFGPIFRLFLKYLVSRQCEQDMLSLWDVIPADDGTYPHPEVWDNLVHIFEIRGQILRALVSHLPDVKLAERHAIRYFVKNWSRKLE